MSWFNDTYIEKRILLNKDAFKAAQDNHGKSKYERWQILE